MFSLATSTIWSESGSDGFVREKVNSAIRAGEILIFTAPFKLFLEGAAKLRSIDNTPSGSGGSKFFFFGSGS